MKKERSLIALLLAIPIVLVLFALKPRSTTLVVLPLYEDPVRRSGAAGERFWVLKTHSTTQYDMILMGDSRLYRGISPQAIEAILPGMRILNFGYSGGGLNPLMYQAAEQRLDPESNHPVIVFGVTPLTLTKQAEKNEHYLQELNRPADYIFMQRYLQPLVRFLEPLNPSTLFRTKVDQASAFTQQGYYQEFYDDGWIASWTIPEDPQRTLQSFRDIFNETPVDAESVERLLEQTQQWTQRGIQVYAFRVPSSPQMVALENQLSGFDEAAFVEKFKNAGGVWFDIPLEPYHSYDGSHLTKEAALKLSTDLGRLINEMLVP
jgi:hypothetical protein